MWGESARQVVHLLSFETNGEWHGRSVWAREVLEQTASDSESRIGLRTGECRIYNIVRSDVWSESTQAEEVGDYLLSRWLIEHHLQNPTLHVQSPYSSTFDPFPSTPDDCSHHRGGLGQRKNDSGHGQH